jgi:hypothetical protein
MVRCLSFLGLIVTVGLGAVALAAAAKNASATEEPVACPVPVPPERPSLCAIPAFRYHAPFSLN